MSKNFTKISLAALMLIAGVSGMEARRINAAEALSTAKEFASNRATTRSALAATDLVLAETAVAENSAEPCYYIFNAANKAGFVIVTADTELPAILGYSNQGSYDPNNVSPAFTEWMAGYKAQIEDWYAQGSPAIASNAVKTRGVEHNKIEPLVQSQWNQSSPYNLLCPKVDGKATYSGCVATSVSQVMHYHKWPQAAVTSAGTHTSARFYPAQTFDFSTATYDWDAMTDTYSSSSTAAANNAVAKLMYAVGVAVDMHWGTSGSGAFSQGVPYAFYHYFNYSPTAFFWERAYYSDDEWDALIYSELEAKRPVVYSGTASGGHSFVCDGYDTGGYYHINWGWGGSQDGYYYLNYLNPQNGGYPGQGNADGEGYNKDQAAVVGIQKPYDGQDNDVVFPVLLQKGSVAFKQVNSSNEWRDDFEFIDLENYEYNSSAYVRLYRPAVYNDAGQKVENRVNLYMSVRTLDTNKQVYCPGGVYSTFENGGYYYKSEPTATSYPGLTYSVMRSPAANFTSLDRIKEKILDVEGYGPGRYKMQLYASYADYVDGGAYIRPVRPYNGHTNYVYVDIDKDGNREYELPDMTGVYVEEVQINPDEISIKPGESTQLVAVCLPATAQNKNVRWSSENPAIATVSSDGKVTGVKAGDCNILAVAQDLNEVVGYCTVNVDPNAGVNIVETSNVVVKGANGVITVSGVANGDAIEVYDVAGARVASRSGVETSEIAMNGAKGVYIVKVGNKSYKVRL